MTKQYNIVHHSLYENDGSNQDWALETSSIIIWDTEFHPVIASPSVWPLGHCPTHNSTVTLPCGMFSQYPSNDLWWSRLGFPDGQLLYTAASIVIGPLHSFPLNLKNHRLHLTELPQTSVFPWNETLIAVSDWILLNKQSYKKCRDDSLGAKKMFIRAL